MSQALFPHLLSGSPLAVGSASRKTTLWSNAAICGAGLVFVSLMAQVSIPLPFTPVPITGQTFAVLLVALTFGRTLAFSTLVAYLVAGAAGLPVFAGGRAGFAFGPTLGYLIGMLVGATVVGALADRGWARTKMKLIATCVVYSICVFSCGLLVLSRFVPLESLLAAGLLPFLPGDVIKTLLAVALMTPAHRLLYQRSPGRAEIPSLQDSAD